MQLTRLAIYGTLFLNGLIITDSFLLPPIKREEIYKMRTSIVTNATNWRSFYTRSYSTEYLVAESGRHYEIPERCYIHRTEKDTVIMGVTRLFRQSATAGWCEERGCFTTNIRLFGTNMFALVILCIATVFPLAMLFFPSLLTSNRESYLYVAAISAVMLFVFYFW